MDALGAEARPGKPVDDDTFAIYRRLYAYDRTPLHVVEEATEERPGWVKHTVAFDAAYGDERMRAFLFLPRNASPPYQTVVFFPAPDAFLLRSSRDMSLAWGELVLRSGRAFLYPVYKGTYERTVSDALGANALRELHIAWSRDLGRALDYLETRTDVDRTRFAFYGVSTGAQVAMVLTALEPRLKAIVLQGVGIEEEASAPEIDPRNFAPRMRAPTLMLSGRYDFGTPYPGTQLALFAMLGSPPGTKRHVVFEAGHALPMEEVAREVGPWLDRYLGPIRP
jgi:predicted esterase